MNKKIFNFLFGTVMLFGFVFFTTPVKAATNYDLWVGGVQVTSNNAKDVLNGGTVSYDADKNILTLNNAKITDAHQVNTHFRGIDSQMDDLTINLIGNNTIDVRNAGNDSGLTAKLNYGINVKDLTITGDGSLEVQSIDYGVYASDLVIENGTSSFIVEQGDASSYGVYAKNITVNGGNITGEGHINSEKSAGIMVSDTLTVKSGTVLGKNTSDKFSYGIKAKNNDYYLKYSFDKTYNEAGWIFADYKNKFNGEDKNIVIYGHNRKDGSMFGSLKDTLNEIWFNDDDNRNIVFITEQEVSTYRVFSIYQIKKEDYYIKTDFKDNEFKKFIETLKKRSIKEFDEEISESSHILTLSTCGNNNKYRTVLHAVKVGEEI